MMLPTAAATGPDPDEIFEDEEEENEQKVDLYYKTTDRFVKNGRILGGNSSACI